MSATLLRSRGPDGDPRARPARRTCARGCARDCPLLVPSRPPRQANRIKICNAIAAGFPEGDQALFRAKPPKSSKPVELIKHKRYLVIASKVRMYFSRIKKYMFPSKVSESGERAERQ